MLNRSVSEIVEHLKEFNLSNMEYHIYIFVTFVIRLCQGKQNFSNCITYSI